MITRQDPLVEARAMATAMGAELAVGGTQTRRAIDQRTAPTASSAAPSARTILGSPAPPDLEALGVEMRRADTVRDRTRQRVADELCRTLNTSLAIHPDTLRRAAAELVEAMQRTALARSGWSTEPKRSSRLARAGSVSGLGAAGAAAAVAATWPVGLAVTGIGVAGGLVSRQVVRRANRKRVPGLEATESLARVRWERLAGTGADPTDVEAAVRRYDPQNDVVGDLLSHHPAVRAAERMADARRKAWVEAWQATVGDVTDPDPHHDRTGTAPPSEDESRPLVVVSPYEGLSNSDARELHLLLLALPRRHQTVIVLGIDADASVPPTLAGGAQTVIDLTDERVESEPPPLTRRIPASER